MGASPLDLGEIGDLVHHRPHARQEPQPVLAQRPVIGINGALSKNSSTGCRNLANSAIASSNRSFLR